ncbi:glutathione S-transferase family protein [Inmirania thermothiophila]|uniref:Putative glutathione S-transferase n=1 Tax=Inmirania thermothiophila TaxID=1750597 RepID=A0A3N1Y1S7_9GAMM|nr:glutathione S-transferase family protein [Inmirania thermothiophila]ROR32785.1 putative glutathione S-transferase [Inmirania thermothiophila]
MAMLVEGRWVRRDDPTDETTGAFLRPESRFRDWVSADGGSGYRAEPGRYHLYVSLACPWAHRTLIFRRLKGLEAVISLSVVEPEFDDGDWRFGDGPGCIPDTVNGCTHVRELYLRTDPRYTGLATVPILWDKRSGRIVNNESADIIRMLNRAFDAWGDPSVDFYPEPLRPEIDRINAEVYEHVNNGVYRAGFARTQAAHEEAVRALFATLDRLEALLSRRRYLAGDRITEADWRLFTTLVRFDAVYYLHFKCNLRRLVDHPNLWAYTRELYQVPGVAETVDMDHIKRHYYRSHPELNPRRIVPVGPELDFTAPHGRG